MVKAKQGRNLYHCELRVYGRNTQFRIEDWEKCSVMCMMRVTLHDRQTYGYVTLLTTVKDPHIVKSLI